MQQAGPAELSDPGFQSVKDATVFIKVGGQGKIVSGTGFIFKTEGFYGYVVTNEHVIHSAGTSNVMMLVVLNSGTDRERRVPALVVAKDQKHDLAFLKIQSATLPKPLRRSPSNVVQQGLPIYILGFPSKAIHFTGNPAITTSKSLIRSIQQSESVKIFQIEGSMDPGNSGGPVVDSAGFVVGVATAGFQGAETGCAIPFEEVERISVGFTEQVQFDKVPALSEAMRYRVEVSLVDPFQNVKGVSIGLFPWDMNQPFPKHVGAKWGPLSKAMNVFPLQVQGDSAVGEILLPSNVEASYLYQTQLTLRNGTLVYSEPGPFRTRQAAAGMSSSPSSKSTSDDMKLLPGTLLGENKKMDGVSLWDIKLDVKNVVQNVVWSPDGRFFYVTDTAGFLRKIAVPSFQEVGQVRIGARVSWLEGSGEGLLVVTPDRKQMLICDMETLAITARIPLEESVDVFSSSSLSLAYSATPMKLLVIDLVAHRVIKELAARDVMKHEADKIRRHENANDFDRFGTIRVAPDGRYLFVEDSGTLHRFKIAGKDLYYEEAGPELGGYGSPIAFSPDSQFVTLVGQTGRGRIPDYPVIGGSGGSYVYRVEDILIPVTAIRGYSRLDRLAFDSKGKLIYGSTQNSRIVVFNFKGYQQRLFPLPDTSEILALFSYPGGKKLIVLTDRHFYWLEFAG